MFGHLQRGQQDSFLLLARCQVVLLAAGRCSGWTLPCAGLSGGGRGGVHAHMSHEARRHALLSRSPPPSARWDNSDAHYHSHGPAPFQPPSLPASRGRAALWLCRLPACRARLGSTVPATRAHRGTHAVTRWRRARPRRPGRWHTREARGARREARGARREARGADVRRAPLRRSACWGGRGGKDTSGVAQAARRRARRCSAAHPEQLHVTVAWVPATALRRRHAARRTGRIPGRKGGAGRGLAHARAHGRPGRTLAPVRLDARQLVRRQRGCGSGVQCPHNGMLQGRARLGPAAHRGGDGAREYAARERGRAGGGPGNGTAVAPLRCAASGPPEGSRAGAAAPGGVRGRSGRLLPPTSLLGL